MGVPTATSAPSQGALARQPVRLGALAFPGVEQLLDITPLRVAELEASEKPPRLVYVVVLHGRLEMLACRDRLAQLPPQPAEKAHLRGFHRASVRSLDGHV